MTKAGTQAGLSLGPSTDAANRPVIDPTENVKDLMAASLDAVKSLRESDVRYNKVVADNLREVAELRAMHANQLRASDLNAAEKTRQVDVLAADNSAKSLATAVSALQAASDRNTETLRNQVADTAQAMAKQTSESASAVQLQTENLFRRTETSIAAVSDRVSTLERTGAAGAGRQSVVDPQIAELLSKMERLVTTQASGGAASEAKSEAKSDTWKWILGGIGALGTLVVIAGAAAAVLISLVNKGVL